MPAFSAKMWHVDRGGRVIGPQDNLLTRGEFAHPFAQAQHGQGAQEAAGIYQIIAHTSGLGTMLQPVYKVVTICADDAAEKLP